MDFLITIDTEEDQWSNYSTSDHTLENIKIIPQLQSLFEKYNALPTYLISYPVASDPDSIKILREIINDKKGEIGGHCHPWSTPPFKEDLTIYNSMLCNLSSDLQYEKLKALTEIIEKNFEIKPTSFRTGRWGYSAAVAENLSRLGYHIDTSLTPFMDWSKYHGPNLSNSPLGSFTFNPRYPLKPNKKGSMFEIPVSIGFNRANFSICHKYFTIMEKSKWARKIFLGGLSRLKILSKIWLSPEISTAAEMINLIQTLEKKGVNHLNLMFHSNSLKPGNTPFVQNDDDLHRFFKRIEKVLEYISWIGCEFVTPSELASKNKLQ